MILITSGAYVTLDFQVELGKIPPCLLPIGNKKLIELQVVALKKTFKNEDIFLTLPESYTLSNAEIKILNSLNVTPILIPDNFKLTESLLYVLNTNEYLKKDDIFYILHGDTYILNFKPLEYSDILTVSQSYDSYYWEVVRSTEKHALVWSGFFSFSSISYLLKALTLNKDSFVDAVKFYSEKYYLKNIEINDWYDLGHTNTYFSSRARITTQRAFNDLKIENGVVEKKGNPSVKIQAEALWYIHIPGYLKKYIPVLLEYGELNEEYYYKLEYLPYIPLNELYVHGKNEVLQWDNILDKLTVYISKSILNKESIENIAILNDDIHKLYVDKSKDRFISYLQSKKISLNEKIIYNHVELPELNFILEDCIEKTLQLDNIYGVLHGDLCFSNILYDSRGDRIKIIDPRGLNYKNEFCIYGDIKYDFAKLTHSIVGFYDFIISGYYKIEESSNGSIQLIFDIDERAYKISNHFIKNFTINDVGVNEIMPLVVLLFLSMLPLHSDRPDRQKAMFYNALRLYYIYIVKNYHKNDINL